MKAGGVSVYSVPVGCFGQFLHTLSNSYFSATRIVRTNFDYARESSPLFDLGCVSILRVVSAVASGVFSANVFPPASLKTLREREWERQVDVLRKRVGEGPAEFCHATALAIDVTFLKLFGEGLRQAPQQIEYLLFYQLQLLSRYVYRQFVKGGVRQEVLETEEMSALRAWYESVSSRFAHAVGRPMLNSLANVELMLLQVSEVLLARKPSPEQARMLKATVFARVARSLSQQAEIDKVRAKRGSDGEKQIATLDWLKRHADLPGSLPDPDCGVLPENLPQKEREALEKYISALLEKLLERHLPPFFRSGLTSGVYDLEGKEHLIALATKVISDVFVTQIGDPHQFALAILYSQGEVMGLEIDGFGLEKEEILHDTGQQILQAVVAGKSEKTIKELFKKSQLRQTPGGDHANCQKEETKRRLKEYFASLFLQLVENKEAAGSPLNAAPPSLGAGSVGRSYLIQGMGHLVEYLRKLGLFASEKTKKYLAVYFATKIIELIYHPSWKIWLLQVADEVLENLEEPPKAPSGFICEDFKKISTFLGSHFFGKLEARSMPVVSVAQTINSLLNTLGVSFTDETMGQLLSNAFLYFTNDGLFEEFQRAMKKPPEFTEPLAKKGMELGLPSIKEATLICRLVDALRKQSARVESDEKFWEHYLRVCLTKLTAKEADHKYPYPEVPNAEQLVAVRAGEVDKLLAMDEQNLIAFLAQSSAPPRQVEHFEMDDPGLASSSKAGKEDEGDRHG